MLDSEFTSYSEHRVLTHQSVCFNSFMVFVSCLNAQNDGLELEEELVDGQKHIMCAKSKEILWPISYVMM